MRFVILPAYNKPWGETLRGFGFPARLAVRALPLGTFQINIVGGYNILNIQFANWEERLIERVRRRFVSTYADAP